ncbi:MAG: hypothetical protein QM731_28530 [Chitinophagaceae bacterium]
MSSYWAAVWQNALGCFIASIPAIFLSWIIFKLTLADNTKAKRKEQEQKDKERLNDQQKKNKERLDYFKYLVSRSYEASKLMEDGIDGFIKETRKNLLDLPDLRYTPLNGLRRVSELQMMDEVLFAFTEKNSKEENAVKEFEQIVNRIDFLHLLYQNLVEQAWKGKNFDHQRQLQVTDSIYKAHFILKKILAPAKGYPIPVVKVLVPILQAYQKLAQKSQTPLTDYIAQFLRPVNAAVIPILNNGYYSDELNELQEAASRGVQVYDSIPIHNKVLTDDVEETTYKKCVKVNSDLKLSIERYL